ncbi:MAG: DUF4388 domain-containing protein [Pyrinomonadaceae bacterium]
MENIERTQFVVLTGHLDDQPLPHLIRRLRAQRKTGRLQVEYPDAPGSFFFEDGQVVDAQLGTLRGVEALYTALSLDGASFNFNPLIRPPARNIDKQGQQFIWDLVEAPRREALPEVKVEGRELTTQREVPTLARNEPLQLAAAHAELIAPLEERLTAIEAAIISTSRRWSRERLIYALVISFLLGLVSVIVLNMMFGSFFHTPRSPAEGTLSATKPNTANGATGNEAGQSSSAAAVKKEPEGVAPQELAGGAISQASDSKKKSNSAAEQAQSPELIALSARDARKRAANSTARGGYVVQVLVQVKNGQVTDARVWKSRPGASAYESRALEIAKQRRYPEDFTGGERLKIRVKP